MRKLTVLALLALALPSHAQTNENQIRSTNSNTSAPACGFGTVSGMPGDVIVFRNRNGVEITALTRTVAYWVARPYAGPILGIDPGSGGQAYSIRFYYGWFLASYPGLAGGTVEILRNGSLLDRDRLEPC